MLGEGKKRKAKKTRLRIRQPFALNPSQTNDSRLRPRFCFSAAASFRAWMLRMTNRNAVPFQHKSWPV